jgi:hypothetical protein
MSLGWKEGTLVMKSPFKRKNIYEDGLSHILSNDRENRKEKMMIIPLRSWRKSTSSHIY